MLILGPDNKRMGANLFVKNEHGIFVYDSEMDTENTKELFNKYQELRESSK